MEIQRDTTVTFEEEDRAAEQVLRKGPYRYGKPSATHPTSKSGSPGSDSMTANEERYRKISIRFSTVAL